MAKSSPKKSVKKKPKRGKRSVAKVPQNSARKNAMISALISTLGIVSTACELVGIDRNTHYNWYEKDEKYKKRVDELLNVSLDFAESKLFETIKGVELDEDKIFLHEGAPVVVATKKRYPPSDANIRFYLDRKGTKRGYGTEQQLNKDKQESIQPPPVTFTRRTTNDNDGTVG